MAERDSFSALRFRDFRFYQAARFFITLGLQIQGVVVGWQVYALTGDPLALGMVGLAEAVSAITISPYGGHLADIFNRKRIIVLSLVGYFLCALALFSLSLPHFSGALLQGVFPIYVVIFVMGITRGCISPAVFAFLSQLIPREEYQNAVVWNSSTWQTASVIGPAIGGLLYGIIGVSGAYSVTLTMILLAIFLMSAIPSRPLPEQSKEHESLSERLTAGFRFVFANNIILGALTLDLFAVLFGGAVALLPIFARDILNVGPQGLGLLRSAPSFGAVVMALLVARFPIGYNAGKVLLASVAGFGLCMIGFALSTSFYLSLAILFASGMLDNVSVVIRSTIMQTMTPDEMRGRVSAVNSMFISSSNEIGAFESGVAAKALGVVPSVIFGGVMTLVVVGITAVKARGLRTLGFGEK